MTSKQMWAGFILAWFAAFGPLVISCGPAVAQAQTPAPNPPLPPLDQLVAPVALYPDALLAQVLTCAASPGQVTDMNSWVQQNSQLHGTALQDAAQQRGYDASFVALALFPDVLNQLASQIDWTTQLGTAYLSDPKGVMDAVQRLRAQAQAAGNLKNTPQQVVTTETQNGQPIIVIQPANPQVVYVPVYNPQVVYWPPPPGAVLLSFGLGIAIGAMISNNTYYAPYGWGAWGMGWHSHTVVCVGRPWVPPPHARYPYVRPVPVPYGGYRPRPYVYAPTTVNVNRTTVNRSGYPAYPGGVTPRPTPYQPVARPPAAVPPPGARRPARCQPPERVRRTHPQAQRRINASRSRQLLRSVRLRPVRDRRTTVHAATAPRRTSNHPSELKPAPTHSPATRAAARSAPQASADKAACPANREAPPPRGAANQARSAREFKHMKTTSIIHVIAAATLLCVGQSALAQVAPQETFATPEDAVVALVEATQTSNSAELRAIFGPDGDKLIQSGDPVMDQRSREVFLVAYGERAELMEDGPTRRVLYIGNEDWPFPIPLVKEGQTWRFDTAAGAQEILVRRIGRNELSTIKVCRVYVDAQNEYAAAPHDFQPSGVYAQRFLSSPGKHDGLYWRSEGLVEQSPLGQFAADAAAEGYRRARRARKREARSPFMAISIASSPRRAPRKIPAATSSTDRCARASRSSPTRLRTV